MHTLQALQNGLVLNLTLWI